ncbi:MAG: hypothetical protein L7F78_01685 [Syntrophales bacterium LBB04]|nr:hypothetical protein [Syntrophales bacterium LBB04]
MPSAANGRTSAPTSPEKPTVPSKRNLIIVGAAVLIILVLVIFLAYPKREKPPVPPLQKKTALLSPEFAADPVDLAAAGVSPANGKDLPSIRTVRLQPPHPTRMDTLKAEVVTKALDPDRITYTYLWKVNDRPVEDAAGDLLNLANFKKSDLVTVTVTPYDGERKGLAVESPFAVVHSIAPSLDLKAPRQTKKAREPLVFQLVSVHPDSDGIIFSLEPPIVPGMSIDAQSGKITWILQPNQKGTIRFGASVEDADKTKVTKTIDITVE